MMTGGGSAGDEIDPMGDSEGSGGVGGGGVSGGGASGGGASGGGGGGAFDSPATRSQFTPEESRVSGRASAASRLLRMEETRCMAIRNSSRDSFPSRVRSDSCQILFSVGRGSPLLLKNVTAGPPSKRVAPRGSSDVKKESKRAATDGAIVQEKPLESVGGDPPEDASADGGGGGGGGGASMEGMSCMPVKLRRPAIESSAPRWARATRRRAMKNWVWSS